MNRTETHSDQDGHDLTGHDQAEQGEPGTAETEHGEAGTAETEHDEPGTAEGQVILVRRRRVPALGFWVLLAVVAAALLGMVLAWVVGVRAPGGMLYFAATAIFLVGAPLALVAAVVDAVIDRRRTGAGRGRGRRR